MDNNTLLFIALAIMMILIVICFIMIAVNSSKISTIMDYSEDGDIIGALKDYYDKVDDLSKTVNDASDAVLMSRLTNCENDSNISIKKCGWFIISSSLCRNISLRRASASWRRTESIL